MRIRMRIAIAGTISNHVNVNPGDIIEVTDLEGAKMCALRYAEPVVDTKEERAVASEDAEVRTAPRRGRPPKVHTPED